MNLCTQVFIGKIIICPTTWMKVARYVVFKLRNVTRTIERINPSKISLIESQGFELALGAKFSHVGIT